MPAPTQAPIVPVFEVGEWRCFSGPRCDLNDNPWSMTEGTHLTNSGALRCIAEAAASKAGRFGIGHRVDPEFAVRDLGPGGAACWSGRFCSNLRLGANIHLNRAAAIACRVAAEANAARHASDGA